MQRLLLVVLVSFMLTGIAIELGPSAPSSFDPPTPGLLNPEVAVDSQSLSQVKALICSPLW